MLFDFLSMAGNYESRKIGRFEKGKILVSTCEVNDSSSPYETAVVHPAFNEGKLIVVEMYDDMSDAKKGHTRWVKRMTASKLPVSLKDVSSAEVASVVDSFGGKDWRVYEAKTPERKVAGKMSDIRIYDKVLSRDKIEALYNAGKKKKRKKGKMGKK